jgi:hypothetical protein
VLRVADNENSRGLQPNKGCGHLRRVATLEDTAQFRRRYAPLITAPLSIRCLKATATVRQSPRDFFPFVPHEVRVLIPQHPP